jgi:hypothetical protein
VHKSETPENGPQHDVRPGGSSKTGSKAVQCLIRSDAQKRGNGATGRAKEQHRLEPAKNLSAGARRQLPLQ